MRYRRLLPELMATAPMPTMARKNNRPLRVSRSARWDFLYRTSTRFIRSRMQEPHPSRRRRHLLEDTVDIVPAMPPFDCHDAGCGELPRMEPSS